MLEAHLSASELARRLKLPAATIMKLRTGEVSNPTISTLTPIAHYFGLTISQLIGELPTSGKNIKIDVTNLSDDPQEQKVTKAPILTWEDSVLWPNKLPVEHYYNLPGHQLSNVAFALIIEVDDYECFQKDGILIIDPQVETYNNDDYVLVHKVGEKRPTLKKVVKEDDTLFMRSLVLSLNSPIQLTSDYRILGIVSAYKKWFKQ